MIITLDIEGMYSTDSADNIENALKKLNGIYEVKVSFYSRKAKIIMDYTASLDMIINTVIKSGYYAYFDLKK